MVFKIRDRPVRKFRRKELQVPSPDTGRVMELELLISLAGKRRREERKEMYNKRVALTMHRQEPEVDGLAILSEKRDFSADCKMRL